MPEALATTKRKFHRLLDSLANASTSVVLTPPAPDDASAIADKPVSARELLEAASERASKRTRASGGSNGDPMTRKLPNFSPWSQESFLSRLQTFSRVSLWHPKPEQLHEVAWAKRGWACTDVNTVACKGGCERRLVIKLEVPLPPTADGGEEDDETVFESAPVHRYQDAIIDGHTEGCLWRRAGCNGDIYRLSLGSPGIWQPDLRNRYRSLLHLSPSIFSIKTRPGHHQDDSQCQNLLSSVRLMEAMPAEAVGKSNAVPDVKAKAFEMAMHGWRGSSDSGNDLLSCDSCFQRIGLWMYLPGYRASRNYLSVAEADDEDSSETFIDLVGMHREHCPWRNATSQHATGSLAGLNGCQILSRVLSTYAREQRRRSEEQSRSELHQSEWEDGDAQEDDDTVSVTPSLSRPEVERQDRERESRLRKLKAIFLVKRSSKAAMQKVL